MEANMALINNRYELIRIIGKGGFGTTWYGGRELFGKPGIYQTLLLDDSYKESIEIKAGYAFTLTISTEPVNDGGAGFEPESWENIKE